MPKRPASSPATRKYGKRKNRTFSLEEKVNILDELDAGSGCSSLGRRYGVNESTIRSIKSKGKKFRKAYTQPEYNKSTLHIREPTYKKMETPLKIWLEDMQRRQAVLSGSMIQTQALLIQEHLLIKEGKSGSDMKFTASHGWLNNFLRRMGRPMQHVKMHGETGYANEKAAEDAKEELKKKLEKEGYTPDQVWNCGETGLSWKTMPKKTHLMKSVGKRPGQKRNKDWITLLLCTNASGTARMKPCFVNKSENPHVFKNVIKSLLPVIWRSNPSAWMNADIFEKWFVNHFIPFVERYNREHNLPNKALLILDNAAVHPKHLKDLHETIKLMFLPLNVTRLVQPLDMGVIAVLNRLYLKESLKEMITAMNNDLQLTAPQFWKKITIKDAVMHIGNAWKSIKDDTLNSVWRSLWPDVVNYFNDFEELDQRIVKENNAIVQLGKEVRDDPGFQTLTTEDVDELVDEMNAPITTEYAIEMAELGQNNGDDSDEEDCGSSKDEEDCVGTSMDKEDCVGTSMDKEDSSDTSKDEEDGGGTSKDEDDGGGTSKDEEDSSTSKDEDNSPPRKEWSITALQSFMASLQDMIMIAKDNDPDLERVMEKVEIFRRVTSDYRNLLDRKIGKQWQRSITSYFKPSPDNAARAESPVTRPPATRPPVASSRITHFFKPVSNTKLSAGGSRSSAGGSESDVDSPSLESDSDVLSETQGCQNLSSLDQDVKDEIKEEEGRSDIQGRLEEEDCLKIEPEFLDDETTLHQSLPKNLLPIEVVETADVKEPLMEEDCHDPLGSLGGANLDSELGVLKKEEEVRVYTPGSVIIVNCM